MSYAILQELLFLFGPLSTLAFSKVGFRTTYSEEKMAGP